MKRHINILNLIICLFSIITSCENEEQILNDNGFRFIPESLQTRSTQTGMFESGDRIGIFAIERTNDSQVGSLSSPKYVNVQYRYNGSYFEPVGQGISYSGKKYDFYVYSPYNAAYNEIRQIIHQASTSQTTESWEEADFCTAINTSGIDNGNVELNFNHKFATLQVKTESDVQGITLMNVFTTGNFDFATDKAGATGIKNNVEMLKEANDSFLATIPVQTISGSVFTIKKSNGKNVEFSLTAPKQLNEGINVIYTVNFKSTITVTSEGNGTATGGGEYEVGENCTVKGTPGNGYSFEGWYDENSVKVSSSAEYTFVVGLSKTLTAKFKSNTPVETWTYTFSVNNSYVTSAWTASSNSFSITSKKQKYIDGVASGAATNVGYSLYSTPDWITANSSGYTSWGENPNRSSRSGNVYWKQNESGYTDYATIYQNERPESIDQVSYEISVTPTSYTFPASGGSTTFTVKSYKVTRTYTGGVLTNTVTILLPFGWTSSVSGTGFSNNGDTVTATANTGTSSRSGIFTVSYMGVSASATLTQEGAKEGEIIIQN